jgi:hypothetical protein
MFRGPCRRECGFGCPDCQIGCFRPARYRNPFFGTDFHNEVCWWRGGYNYAEYLCVECYESMVADAKEWEDVFRGEEGYEEDLEYTRILEGL